LLGIVALTTFSGAVGDMFDGLFGGFFHSNQADDPYREEFYGTVEIPQWSDSSNENGMTEIFDEYSIWEGTLLVLDAYHWYQGEENMVQPGPDVRPTDGYGTPLYHGDYTNIYLTEETLDAFNRMIYDCYVETGYDSAIADRLYLESIYNHSTVTLSDDAAAILSSGTALILADSPTLSAYDAVSIYKTSVYKEVSAYRWIDDNAHRYGFVHASSLSNERHIFRYVGVPHAMHMTQHKLSFEEYLDRIYESNYPDSYYQFTVDYKTYSESRPGTKLYHSDHFAVSATILF
jgi:hypothetical protein